jgi:non-lysosomal glucosylceramidase
MDWLVHDRYDATMRNPYNEIECSDHYARAMASYGAFVAACGYRYHGPEGFLAFDPKLTPENFKAAFTTAEGWGTYTQEENNDTQTHTIDIKCGHLKVQRLMFKSGVMTKSVTVTLAGKRRKISAKFSDGTVEIDLGTMLNVAENELLMCVIGKDRQ